MMRIDFSHLRLDDLPFGDISLRRSDMRRLLQCSKRKIFEGNDDMLVAYGFARQETSCTGGSTMPKPNGYISITLRGRAYLDYVRKERRRYLIPQLLSLFAFVVSAISLLVDILGFILLSP